MKETQTTLLPKPNPFDTILNARRYNADKEPEEETRIIMINSRIIATNQNIVTMQAKQKAGKTVFFTGMMAAALSRSEVFRILVLLKPGKKRIAYFDTEQGESDFYKTIRRTKSLAGIHHFPEWFDAYNMREDDPKTIIGAINRYTETHPDCGLLLIDNSTDLLNSFNDEAESKTKIQNLKRWSKTNNNVIVQALHTGRGGENSLGHYGAFSDRASQSVLHIEKTERGTICMKPHYMRSDEDFDPVELMYDREIHNWSETIHIPEADRQHLSKDKVKASDFEKMEHRARLSYIFNVFPFCSYDKLINGIMEIYGQPKQWARESIRYLLQEQIVFKTMDGYTINQQAKLYVE